MIIGNVNELAIDISLDTLPENDEFILGSLVLIVKNARYFSSIEGVTISSAIRYMASGIELLEIKSERSSRDLFFLGCLMHHYLYDGYVPNLPTQIWNSEDSTLAKFVDDYTDLISKTGELLGCKNEIGLIYDFTDIGCRVFCFYNTSEEIIVCSENFGRDVFMHKIPLGSCDRFMKEISAFLEKTPSVWSQVPIQKGPTDISH